MRSWRIIIVLCCVFYAACTTETSLPATRSLSGETSPPSLQPETDPVVLFARNDDLWRTDIRGKTVERLTEEGLLNWNMAIGHDWQRASIYRPPQMSPDGRWVALSRTGRDLVLVNVETGDQKQLPQPGAPFVTWAPDSDRFAYVVETSAESVEDGKSALYLYDVTEEKTTRLLQRDKPAGVGIVRIVWSPDGRQIAFGCCFTSQADSGTRLGQIQKVDVASGQFQTTGEIRSSVGGGAPPLCWTAEGEVVIKHNVAPATAVRCSHERLWPNALSPDGKLVAGLAAAEAEDERWAGPSRLTITQVDTETIVWQRDLPMSAKRITWSSHGRFLLLDDEKPHSPIWRIPADGAAAPEVLVENGYLLPFSGASPPTASP